MSSKPEELDFSNHAPLQSSDPEVPATVTTAEEQSEPSLEFSDTPLHPAFQAAPTPFSKEEVLRESTSALSVSNVTQEVAGPESEADEEPQRSKAEVLPAPQQPELVSTPNWTSAAGALQWLKSLEKANSPGRIWLAKHRGDISIALSALVLLIALTGWGLHPGSGGSAGSRLTLFERMLVSLGVAEAPPQPTATGNPNVWVWVDVHTALYYCPGSDLYGKTPGGKFALQRDAQIDQFQPAVRTTCQ